MQQNNTLSIRKFRQIESDNEHSLKRDFAFSVLPHILNSQRSLNNLKKGTRLFFSGYFQPNETSKANPISNSNHIG